MKNIFTIRINNRHCEERSDVAISTPMTHIRKRLLRPARSGPRNDGLTIFQQSLNENGFTLIDVILTIIIAGILAAVALRSVVKLADTAKTEETKQELAELEYAIVGNPQLFNDDTRADFGYVGDVGALPGNLDALFTNPGGYATWKGPYVKRRFEQDANDYKQDAWGTDYAYTGGVTVTSSGSGSDVVRKFGEATSDFLSNGVDGVVLDLDGTPPGTIYKDSIAILLTVPNGTGGYVVKTATPDIGGFFSIDAVAIGNHDLQVIYQPLSDTLKRFVSVLPKSRNYGQYKLGSNIGSGGGVSVSSPEILRPSAPGTYNLLFASGCGALWECVNETVADEDAAYIYGTGGSWDAQTFNAQNSSVNSGIIDSVKIFIRAKDFKARTAIRTNGTKYESADITLTASYTNYSKTYVTNPNTLAAWTWSEINAIEIGVTIKEEGRSTQVWLEVHYH